MGGKAKEDTKKEKKTKIELEKPELSDEDKAFKERLDIIVSRISDDKRETYAKALDELRVELRDTKKSSVASVPKPLKFLKDHYEPLKELFEKKTMDDKDTKVFADILSVLSITMQEEGERNCLKYKLVGDKKDIVAWGFEYIRSLTSEIILEYHSRKAEKDVDVLPVNEISDLLGLVEELVEYYKSARHEIDACDLLMELDRSDNIRMLANQDNYKRIIMYLYQVSKYKIPPENVHCLEIAYDICTKVKNLTRSLRIAMIMNDMDKIRDTFTASEDKLMSQQLALILGRQNIVLDIEEDSDEEESEDEDESDDDDDEGYDLELEEIMGNAELLKDNFRFYAKELDQLDPLGPEDVYKEHLEDASRVSGPTQIDSAKMNLASTFVSAFANAGFGTDKLMTQDRDWVFRTKDHGKMSAVASVGMVHLWDPSVGLNELNKYLFSGDNYDKAGAYLGFGIAASSVRSDIVSGLLRDKLNLEDVNGKIGAILGLGIAYAGSYNEDIREDLIAKIADENESMPVVAFSALALGQIFVGSCNEEIISELMQIFYSRSETDLKDTVTRFVSLGVGLLFFGRQDKTNVILDAMNSIPECVRDYLRWTIDTCANVGTGNVLKIQDYLNACGQHHNLKKEKVKDFNKEEEKEEEEKVIDTKFQSITTLGVAMIALGEDIGSQMALRLFESLFNCGDLPVKRAVPLGLGMLHVSQPTVRVMDTLSKFTHDSDDEIASNGILSLGLIGAGTKNARIAKMLRELAVYYKKSPSTLFIVKIAQGLLYAGKGLVSFSPLHSENLILKPVALSSLLILMHAAVDMKKTILSKYHYLIYELVNAIRPRMFVTVNEKFKPVKVNVRVGQAVDVVGKAGTPKSITGFQTYETPVTLQYSDKAEFASNKYIPLTDILEGIVIVKRNPDYDSDEDDTNK